MKLSLWYPVKPLQINQKFGTRGDWYRRNGINVEGHNGWDFNATHGQKVYAAHDGVVLYAGTDSKEGFGVTIRTDKKYEYKGGEAYFKTIYWHLIPMVPVKVGQRVKAGDLIGYADNTGFSTGDHLHFGLKPLEKRGVSNWVNIEADNGYFGSIDPEPYFNGYFAPDKLTVISLFKKMIELLQAKIDRARADKLYNEA